MKKLLITFILCITPSTFAMEEMQHENHEPSMKMEHTMQSTKQNHSLHKNMRMMKPGSVRNESTDAYVKAMHTMHEDMDIQFTRDPDLDFLAGMIPHHQGAIDMAKVQLKYGMDGAAKAFTGKVIRDQEREITQMEILLASLTDERAKNPFTCKATPGYKAANKKMHEGMTIRYTGNADIDFMRGMIPHHQGAIDMAYVVLQHGKDSRVKRFARQIIDAQVVEIRSMENWFRRLRLSPA